MTAANSLAGKNAIVTGGGRGIGRGIALALADAGADLVIADIDLENAERTAKDINGRGRQAVVIRTDVTDSDAVNAAVARTVEALGGLDILVNNAGVIPDGVGLEVGDAAFDLCHDVNVKGIWKMSTAAIPHFQARGGGKIVNIASIAGRKGGAGLAPYCASKAAAISVTQSLAAALGRDNVNVNAVCPGLLWTDMWRKLEGMFGGDPSSDVVEARRVFDAFLASNCPLRREQTAQDIGHAVAFLVSDAARNITGQSLNVDGGIEMN